ncbi:MAG: hypothetical protein H0W74_12270 [Sphingosinicella sp.]|nr:hypothetical protein [Sphingosinicella sp.]
MSDPAALSRHSCGFKSWRALRGGALAVPRLVPGTINPPTVTAEEAGDVISGCNATRVEA